MLRVASGCLVAQGRYWIVPPLWKILLGSAGLEEPTSLSLFFSTQSSFYFFCILYLFFFFFYIPLSVAWREVSLEFYISSPNKREYSAFEPWSTCHCPFPMLYLSSGRRLSSISVPDFLGSLWVWVPLTFIHMEHLRQALHWDMCDPLDPERGWLSCLYTRLGCPGGEQSLQARRAFVPSCLPIPPWGRV